MEEEWKREDNKGYVKWDSSMGVLLEYEHTSETCTAGNENLGGFLEVPVTGLFKVKFSDRFCNSKL